MKGWRRMSKILIPGRWQVPELHDGHKALIQSALDEGHIVVVAIRDTEKDDKNPYNAVERKAMIWRSFPLIKIVIIPDFDEIWVGRDVGYKVVRLSKELESISGTDIRNKK